MKFEGKEIHYKGKDYIIVAYNRNGFATAIKKANEGEFPAPMFLIPDPEIQEALKLVKIEAQPMEL